MKNSIKREQSQACLNFAERKNFRLQAKYKILMTLALLLTAVTGAWAQSTLNVVELEVPAAWDGDNSNVTAADLPGFKNSTLDEVNAWTGAPTEGFAVLFYAFDGEGNAYYVSFDNGAPFSDHSPFEKYLIFGYSKSNVKIYYTAAAGPKVTWNASTKTGTFSMPGSDVVLTPIYAKAAAFATTGTGTEAKTLLPEAAEGVIADTDAPLIKEGTGIVAFAGTSTEAKQGTLMYAVTPATETQAPALDAANKWSADVPTAKTVADGGIDVLVWYYIKGADTPQGEAATLDNTFNDTEPASLTVQVLSNKFDIQLSAANANTIEAGKATVTVGGTDKTSAVTDGKLKGVKMGSEVKLEAKPGYKFRKVEVKKKEAGPLAAAFEDGAKIKVGYQWNTYNTTYLEFTNSGGTYSLTSVSGKNEGNGFNSSTLTAKDGNVLALDVVCNPFGPKEDDFSAQIEFDATSSTYKYSSKGSSFTGIISVSVNDTDITSQLTELK